MSHSAKLLAHSISEAKFNLYTFEVCFPRIVLAEMNTHRMLSRNSASSRAIPVQTMIKMVTEHPYVPASWGKSQKGMQEGEDLSREDAQVADSIWLRKRDEAVEGAQALLKLGVHKQRVNRLLEPFMWHTAIISATELSNLFHLRDNPDAHPDLRACVHLMKECVDKSMPELIFDNAWHTPLILEEDYREIAVRDGDNKAVAAGGDWHGRRWVAACKISVGRCARVSYLTHDGKRDLDADFELHDRLLGSGHMSPFEHVARPMTEEEMSVAHRKHLVLKDKKTGVVTTQVRLPSALVTARALRTLGAFDVVNIYDTYFCGNFNGWMQYRKTIPYEHDILAPR